MKVYMLGLPKELESSLYNIMQTQEAYGPIEDVISDFDSSHGYSWQAGFRGRSGGYLVLYSGCRERSGHKSVCTKCGQRNFKTVEETGTNRCGRCKENARVNQVLYDICKYPGRSVDQGEDFSGWTMEALRDRVRLVCDFDALADAIAAEAKYLAENYDAVEEEVLVPRKRMVLKEKTA
jgi:hypothetical protein